MFKEYLKKKSASLVNRKIKIETKMKCCFSQIWMMVIGSSSDLSDLLNGNKGNPSTKQVVIHINIEIFVVIHQNIRKIGLPYVFPTNPISVYYPRRAMLVCWRDTLHKVLSSQNVISFENNLGLTYISHFICQIFNNYRTGIRV